MLVVFFFCFKQKTAYEMRISDWSSDVCSSDLKVGMRGQVRIVTASLSDNSTTIAAARSLYSGLFRHRVRIFEYLPCKLHMKLIVIDDIVYIGSANFDMRSLFINLELMMRIEDAGFAAQIREVVTCTTTNLRATKTNRKSYGE